MRLTVTFVVCVAIHLAGAVGRADDYALPRGGDLIDVTAPPYNAKGDGRTDDTAAIRKAFQAAQNHRGKLLVYFPNGTYRVSGVDRSYSNDRLHGTLTFAGRKDPTVVVGQSREGTVIRLQDRDPAFQNPDQAIPVLIVGRAGPSDFGHGVYNLTVDVGAGNPAARGLQYHTSNNGSVVNVRVRSSDPEGAGRVGFDLDVPNPGPGLMQHIEADGFDVGIRLNYSGFNMVFEHVTLRGQREAGILSDRLPFALRGLKSNNRVPAIRLTSPDNYACLVEGELVGEGVPEGVAAIENLQGGALYVRDVDVRGYPVAIVSAAGRTTRYVPPGRVDLFTSHPAKAATPGGSTAPLRLAIEDAPELPWPTPDAWVSVTDYGAVSGDKADDAPALQRAIDDGAEDIYFPNGEYTLASTVHVRGRTRRIHGMSSRWSLENPADGPIFRIEDGRSPVVIIERWKPQPGANDGVFVDHASTRTLVLRQGVFNNYVNSVRGGKVFIEDVTGAGRVFDGQKVWIRQMNPEARGHGAANITNRGGDLWLLGIKTEGERTAIETTDGGRTELLGVNLYPHQGTHGDPAFICRDAEVALSYSMDSGWTHPDDVYEEQLRVIEGGQTLAVWRGDFYKRGGYLERRGGVLAPLVVHRRPVPNAADAPAESPDAGEAPNAFTRGGLGRTASFSAKAIRQSPQAAWQVKTDPNNGPPIVADGVCYFGDRMGGFWSVDAESGKVRWHVDARAFTGARGPYPAVGRGMVFHGAEGQMLARDTRDGRLVWRFDTDGGTWFPPAVVADLVLFTSAEGVVYGAEADTGIERWWLRTPTPIASGVVVEGRSGFVGLRQGVIAFDVQTGERQWLFETGAGVPFPIVRDGRVYVAAEKLWAVDAVSGKAVWQRKLFPEQAIRWALDGDRLFVGGPRVNGIHILDADTGEPVGEPIRFDDHGNRNRPTAMAVGPAVADGVLYYTQYGTWQTVAVDLATRAKLWEGPPTGGFGSEPYLDGRTLYFSSRGAIEAYRQR